MNDDEAVIAKALGLAETVWCEDCSHSMTYVTTTRTGARSELPAYRWLCGARPRDDRGNHVSRTLRLSEPYYRCADVNGGDCRLYVAKRSPANV